MSPELTTSPAAEPLSGGRPMTRRFSLRRTGALVLAGVLLFVLAGDRVMTAPPQGIDPLEMLNLQVKPNVIVALDTSGSMEDTPYVASSYGGDHKRSKMWQAKQVLKDVFQDNQDKASFMFGVYRYSSAANPVKNMTLQGERHPQPLRLLDPELGGGDVRRTRPARWTPRPARPRTRPTSPCRSRGPRRPWPRPTSA